MIVCIAGAVAVCATACTRYLVLSPDVQWNKSSRMSVVRDNHTEGNSWYVFVVCCLLLRDYSFFRSCRANHKKSKVLEDISQVGILRSLRMKYE